VNFRKIIVSQFAECVRETERTLPLFSFKILNFVFSFMVTRILWTKTEINNRRS